MVGDLGIELKFTYRESEALTEWSSGKSERVIAMAFAATSVLRDQKPMTLRSLHYRMVGCGISDDTSDPHYDRLCRVMTSLRECLVVPFHWMTDNLRVDIKKPTFDSPEDAVPSFCAWFNMNYWNRFNHHVHVIVEKDAMTGVLRQVTDEWDVTLSPIRGYASVTYAAQIAKQWEAITKPIFVYYLGDYDPSGFDIERDMKEKLYRYSRKDVEWTRLGVVKADFEEFGLRKLSTKVTDKKAAKFIAEHGPDCAEIDAIPPNDIRKRLREAIVKHIPPGGWEQCQKEEAEMIDRLEGYLRNMPKMAPYSNEQN